MTTQKASWKGFEFIDRQSVLIDENGGKDDLDPDTTAALLGALGSTTPQGVREFLTEVLADAGVGDMADLDTAQLSSIVQGILA